MQFLAIFPTQLNFIEKKIHIVSYFINPVTVIKYINCAPIPLNKKMQQYEYVRTY